MEKLSDIIYILKEKKYSDFENNFKKYITIFFNTIVTLGNKDNISLSANFFAGGQHRYNFKNFYLNLTSIP